MITVKMTPAEYKAYLLYLKSIEVLQEAGEKVTESNSLKQLHSDTALYREIETSIEEVNEGKVTYIDPDHLWENIQ
jgi:hypothetical protein